MVASTIFVVVHITHLQVLNFEINKEWVNFVKTFESPDIFGSWSTGIFAAPNSTSWRNSFLKEREWNLKIEYLTVLMNWKKFMTWYDCLGSTHVGSNDCTCKKCSGLQKKSCRLNYVDENCQGLSIHKLFIIFFGGREVFLFSICILYNLLVERPVFKVKQWDNPIQSYFTPSVQL